MHSVVTLVPFFLVMWVSTFVFSLSIFLGKPPFCGVQDAFFLLIPATGLHFTFNVPTLVFQSEHNALEIAYSQSEQTSELQRVFGYLKFFTPAK